MADAPARTSSTGRLVRMVPRDPDESGRTASTLELFFDLVFVIAASNASPQLHHALGEGHVASGLFSYAVVFFGIWWAWMNFTWFATSFDADDWLSRILTFVQMAGVIVLAAGIESAFARADLHLLIYGYVLMRVAMVAQWLRAARCGGPTRRTALTYAVGIGLVQVLWLGLAELSWPAARAGIGVLIAAELAVPVVAERRGGTPTHPHHITERYGLFTLIVLGESLLASANAIIAALHDSELVGALSTLAALVLIIAAALWWIYFWPEHHHCVDGLGRSLHYGYTHYVVFAAAAAVSVGVELQIDQLTHAGHLGPIGTGYALAVPIAVFLLGMWWVAIGPQADRVVRAAVPSAALVILIDPLLPTPVLSTAVVHIALVAVRGWRPPRPGAKGAALEPRSPREDAPPPMKEPS